MSTDLRLGIDARQGEAGAKKYVAALNSIKAALAGLQRAGDGTFAALNKSMQLPPKGTAKTALEGTTKAAKQTELAAQRLATSTTNAMTTAGVQVDKLKAQFAALSSDGGIRAAEKAFADFQARASKATNTAGLGAAKADYRATITGLQAEARAQEQAAKATALHAKELVDLKTKFDPIFATSSLYEKQLGQLNAAHAAGVLSAAQHENALQHLNTQLQMGVVSSNKYSQSVRVSSMHMTGYTANIVSQFNDIGVMLAAGQSPLLLAMQQGTQLSQVLNQIGGGPTSVLGALKSGFMAMVNPISLITIGSIAAGAALFQAFSKTRPEVREFGDVLKDATSEIERAASAAGDVRNFATMREAYGDTTREVRELVKARQELAKMDATNAWKELQSAMSVTNATGHKLRTELQRMQRDLGLSATEARAFRADMKSALSINDPAKYADQIRIMRAQLVAASGGVEKMTDSQAEMYQKLVDSEDAARKLASIDLAAGPRAAADEAARLAEKYGMSVSLAARLAGMRAGPNGNTISGFEGDDPRNSANAGKWTGGYSTSWSPWTPSKTGSSGGGAGQESEIQRVTRALEEQKRTYELLASGVVQTQEAARLLAEAQLNGTIDASTESAIQAADAIAVANQQLEKLVNTSGQGLNAAAADGLKSGLKQGFSDALKGDGKNFAANIANSVRDRMAATLSNKFVDMLGLEKLFGNMTMQPAAAVAGTTISQSMITAGQVVATQIGAAITTGQAAGQATSAATGGSWITALFGFGSEGGISGHLPATGEMPLSAFKNAPHYKEGTANTTNAIPSVLHPNEAVIPLSRGRKVPVEMNGGGGGSVVVGDIHTTVNIDGDASADDATEIANKVSETIDGRIRQILAEEMTYGGVMNPRGGW